MLRLDFKFKRPHISGTMVREDMVDFIDELQKTLPGTVFFDERDKKDGLNEVYASPFDYVEARHRSNLHIEFRTPSRKELLDGRPEVLSGGKALPLRDITKADLRWAGRFGSISRFMIPRFDEAILPAFATDEFHRLRRIASRDSLYREFDTEDSRYHRAQPDWPGSLRVFDDDNSPGIGFIRADDNQEMKDYIKTIRDIWFSRLVKTGCRRDLETGEMIEMRPSQDTGVSKRIMDACALNDNLFVDIIYDRENKRYLGFGPTDRYRAQVRKRAGLPASDIHRGLGV